MGAFATSTDDTARWRLCDVSARRLLQSFDNGPTNNFKRWFEKGAREMTRPSDITRERILKAAERLFADRGYEETSIRAIVTKARVNQAAINYHFKGKDGLYREVLRMAFRALTKHQLAHAQEMKGMSRENALGEFIRHQLHPLGNAANSAGTCAFSIGKPCVYGRVSQTHERGGGAFHGACS